MADSAEPSGWWDDGELNKRHSGHSTGPGAGSLASRAACVICFKTPTHLQKDCPSVKEGSGGLEQLLQVRQAQLKEEKQKKSQGKANANRGKRTKNTGEEVDTAGMAEHSITVIVDWITRLKHREALKKKVEGRAAVSESTPSSAEVQSPSSSLLVPATQDRPVADPTEARSATSAATPSKSAPNTPKAPTPGEPSTVRILHQKALERARRRPRKAGSLSGLSASDAVIETGSSDSETESPASISTKLPSIEPNSDESASEAESDVAASGPPSDEAGSDADDAPELDAEGDIRMADATNQPGSDPEEHASSSDDDNDDGNADSESDEPHSSARSSSASSSSRRSTSPSTSSSMSNGDPEASFLRMMQKPLSAKEKKQARLSAASLGPSQTLDALVEDDSSDVDDIEDDEGDVVPVPSQRRRGSDSSIDVGHGEDDDEVMETMSDIRPSSPSQPPVVLGDDDEPEDESGDGVNADRASPPDTAMRPQSPEPASDTQRTDVKIATPKPKRHSTSLVEMDREAGASPEVEQSEGARALEAAIADEETPRILVEETFALDKRPRLVISQGLPSPPSSNGDEDLVATQLQDVDTSPQTTPRPKRSTRGAGRPSRASQRATQPSVSQVSQTSQPPRRSARGAKSVTVSPSLLTSALPAAESSQPTSSRRMRSVSRELPESTSVTSRTPSASRKAGGAKSASQSKERGGFLAVIGETEASQYEQTASQSGNKKVSRGLRSCHASKLTTRLPRRRVSHHRRSTSSPRRSPWTLKVIRHRPPRRLVADPLGRPLARDRYS